MSIFCFFIATEVNWLALPQQFWIYAVLGGIEGSLGNGIFVKALQNGDLSILGPIKLYKSFVRIVVAILLLGEVLHSLGKKLYLDS